MRKKIRLKLLKMLMFKLSFKAKIFSKKSNPKIILRFVRKIWITKLVLNCYKSTYQSCKALIISEEHRFKILSFKLELLRYKPSSEFLIIELLFRENWLELLFYLTAWSWSSSFKAHKEPKLSSKLIAARLCSSLIVTILSKSFVLLHD